jgi:restriction endonuclease Mrr
MMTSAAARFSFDEKQRGSIVIGGRLAFDRLSAR